MNRLISKKLNIKNVYLYNFCILRILFILVSCELINVIAHVKVY